MSAKFDSSQFVQGAVPVGLTIKHYNSEYLHRPAFFLCRAFVIWFVLRGALFFELIDSLIHPGSHG